jgi:predicted metalloprotease with PDZ domain
MLGALTFHENKKYMGHAEPNGEWVFSGYSADENNNLNKIVDYYLKKK